jgi:hypothetical protein
VEGRSFTGRLSTAFAGVVLFSSAAGVTAYSGTTGERLWSATGAVPEGADPDDQRIYLTKGADLVGVSPLTGRVKGTVSGSAVNASAGVYAVRGGVALGLDQGGSGDAWGYDIAVQRVTLTAPGLSWPHYFVDLSGVGGSAEESGDLVIIAACAQVAATPSPTQTLQALQTSNDTQATQTTQATPTPVATPSPGAPAAQGCVRPELVALGL